MKSSTWPWTSLSSATPLPNALTSPSWPASHGGQSSCADRGQRAVLVADAVLVGAAVDDVDRAAVAVRRPRRAAAPRRLQSGRASPAGPRARAAMQRVLVVGDVARPVGETTTISGSGRAGRRGRAQRAGQQLVDQRVDRARDRQDRRRQHAPSARRGRRARRRSPTACAGCPRARGSAPSGSRTTSKPMIAAGARRPAAVPAGRARSPRRRRSSPRRRSRRSTIRRSP